MTLEQHKYRNPLDVLIEEEQRTCKGCVHEVDFHGFGKIIWICIDKNNKGLRRNHGKRCKNYTERTCK